MSRAVVVIGIGNPFRGDDAAGLMAVQRMADLNREAGIEVLLHEGDGAALLELWTGAEAVVLVDTVRSGASPGTIHRVDASASPVPQPLSGISSHAVGVAQAIELSRALGSLPPQVLVCGVEGSSFETGAGLSGAVAATIERLADAVHSEAMSLAQGQLCSGTTRTGRLEWCTTA